MTGAKLERQVRYLNMRNLDGGYGSEPCLEGIKTNDLV
jgi:hypothetical protein